MSTNRNILQKISNQELENYVLPDSKSVPEDIIAYDILQSRGWKFSHKETKRIDQILAEKKRTEAAVHPMYIKAANILYLTGAMAIANIIWTYELFNNLFAILIAVTTLAFIFIMGYLASKGTDWVKYVLLVTLILESIGFPKILSTLQTDPVLAIINILQNIAQAYIIFLLFKVPKVYNP